jgi:hypothetical protein
MLNTLRYLIAVVMWRLQCIDFIRRHVWRWGNLAGGRRVDWEPRPMASAEKRNCALACRPDVSGMMACG